MSTFMTVPREDRKGTRKNLDCQLSVEVLLWENMM